MKSAEERKQQSIALLKEQGVPYIEHLPGIETGRGQSGCSDECFNAGL